MDTSHRLNGPPSLNKVSLITYLLTHSGQHLAQPAGAYPGFRSMKPTVSIAASLGWHASPSHPSGLTGAINPHGMLTLLLYFLVSFAVSVVCIWFSR